MQLNQILNLAEENQNKAREVIADSRVVEIWQGIGAKINLIGSLKMGLLMTHWDIDFHIYTPQLEIKQSFAAMQQLAENPRTKEISYRNLLNGEDACLEWHAWFEGRDGELWQMDMIHILCGSKYDGYFEKMAERIKSVMTPQQRETILELKYNTPSDLKIAGIEYYLAVLRDGIAGWEEFAAWRNDHPQKRIIEWMP